MSHAALRSPTNGVLLGLEGYTLTDGARQFPIVDGIPFLRVDREALCADVLSAVHKGDHDVALALLLRDQDPFAPLPPPTLEQAVALVREHRAGTVGFAEALERLQFGPVANYFKVRPSTPTFLSGLGLIARYGRPTSFVEIACGTGQLLREVARRGVPSTGVDLVFSKLWLARHFVVRGLDATLVCADVCRPLPLAPASEWRTVLCHDAFYFLPDKAATLAQMREIAGANGRVLIGHTHNAYVDSGVAGTSLIPEDYATLAPGAAFFDDAELTREALGLGPAPVREPSELRNVEAISFAYGEQGSYWEDVLLPPAGTPLHLNPLLTTSSDVGNGAAPFPARRNGAAPFPQAPFRPALAPRWPSERMANEYRDASYLNVEAPVPAAVLAAAAAGDVGRGTSAEVDALARRRVLVEAEALQPVAAGEM